VASSHEDTSKRARKFHRDDDEYGDEASALTLVCASTPPSSTFVTGQGERGRFVAFRPGHTFSSLESDAAQRGSGRARSKTTPTLKKATGDVFFLPTTGATHICTESKCSAMRVDRASATVLCPVTGRVYQQSVFVQHAQTSSRGRVEYASYGFRPVAGSSGGGSSLSSGSSASSSRNMSGSSNENDCEENVLVFSTPSSTEINQPRAQLTLLNGQFDVGEHVTLALTVGDDEGSSSSMQKTAIVHAKTWLNFCKNSSFSRHALTEREKSLAMRHARQWFYSVRTWTPIVAHSAQIDDPSATFDVVFGEGSSSWWNGVLIPGNNCNGDDDNDEEALINVKGRFFNGFCAAVECLLEAVDKVRRERTLSSDGTTVMTNSGMSVLAHRYDELTLWTSTDRSEALTYVNRTDDMFRRLHLSRQLLYHAESYGHCEDDDDENPFAILVKLGKTLALHRRSIPLVVGLPKDSLVSASASSCGGADIAYVSDLFGSWEKTTLDRSTDAFVAYVDELRRADSDSCWKLHVPVECVQRFMNLEMRTSAERRRAVSYDIVRMLFELSTQYHANKKHASSDSAATAETALKDDVLIDAMVACVERSWRVVATSPHNLIRTPGLPAATTTNASTTTTKPADSDDEDNDENEEEEEQQQESENVGTTGSATFTRTSEASLGVPTFRRHTIGVLFAMRNAGVHANVALSRRELLRASLMVPRQARDFFAGYYQKQHASTIQQHHHLSTVEVLPVHPTLEKFLVHPSTSCATRTMFRSPTTTKLTESSGDNTVGGNGSGGGGGEKSVVQNVDNMLQRWAAASATKTYKRIARVAVNSLSRAVMLEMEFLKRTLYKTVAYVIEHFASATPARPCASCTTYLDNLKSNVLSSSPQHHADDDEEDDEEDEEDSENENTTINCTCDESLRHNQDLAVRAALDVVAAFHAHVRSTMGKSHIYAK
jgi:hypothetical protein